MNDTNADMNTAAGESDYIPIHRVHERRERERGSGDGGGQSNRYPLRDDITL